jgi:hypothetical protein
MQDDQMQRDLLANFCARALDEDIAASPWPTCGLAEAIPPTLR